eukprot:scaffold25739_cov118-Isochrysis_galbana.AAC.2
MPRAQRGRAAAGTHLTEVALVHKPCASADDSTAFILGRCVCCPVVSASTCQVDGQAPSGS